MSAFPTTAPRVTVVMPAYNRAALIGESIASALAQRFGDLELVVVDDGSTDATAAVVRQIRDPRVRLLQRPHRGLSAAANAGVRAGHGAYVARLDSDDLWEPDFLACTVAAMERPPRVGVVYTRATTFAEPPASPEPDRGLPLAFPDDPFASMLLRDHASGAALFRRECHDRVGGFDESLRWWEDWDFWIRVSRHYAFRFIDRPLARFRIHPDNTSGTDGAAAWATRTRVLDKAFAALPALTPKLERIQALAYRNAHFDAALHYWHRRAVRHALAELRRGIRASGQPARASARAAYVLFLHHCWHVAAVRRTRRAAALVRSGWRTARRAGTPRCDR